MPDRNDSVARASRNATGLGNVESALIQGITSDPRIRDAFNAFVADGKISVEQAEPVIGDTILNIMQRLDLRDGRDDNRISRRAIASMISDSSLTREQRANFNSFIAAIPANGIALHPENVNRVVSSSLRTADANDDWQLTMPEIRNLATLILARTDEMVERPNVPQRSAPVAGRRPPG